MHPEPYSSSRYPSITACFPLFFHCENPNPSTFTHSTSWCISRFRIDSSMNTLINKQNKYSSDLFAILPLPLSHPRLGVCGCRHTLQKLLLLSLFPPFPTVCSPVSPSLSLFLSHPFLFLSFPLLWLWNYLFQFAFSFFKFFLSCWLNLMFSISRTLTCLPYSKPHKRHGWKGSLPPTSLQPLPPQGREPTWSSALSFLCFSLWC